MHNCSSSAWLLTVKKRSMIAHSSGGFFTFSTFSFFLAAHLLSGKTGLWRLLCWQILVGMNHWHLQGGWELLQTTFSGPLLNICTSGIWCKYAHWYICTTGATGAHSHNWERPFLRMEFLPNPPLLPSFAQISWRPLAWVSTEHNCCLADYCIGSWVHQIKCIVAQLLALFVRCEGQIDPGTCNSISRKGWVRTSVWMQIGVVCLDRAILFWSN